MSARKKARTRPPLPIVGWREWVGLPGLGIHRIKAKIDTGARSSAIHALQIETIRIEGEPGVRFKVQPLQRRSRPVIQIEARLHDERRVRNSGGGSELRPVILTEVELGDVRWPIELTLTNRELMGFRFLLGRQAIRRRYLVDTGRSYLHGERDDATRPHSTVS